MTSTPHLDHDRRLPAPMTRGTRLGWIGLGVLVTLVVAWIVRELAASDNGMSSHGWIALILGTIGTCALAGVLMWLLFRSARHDGQRDF